MIGKPNSEKNGVRDGADVDGNANPIPALTHYKHHNMMTINYI
jgi:hypothetical protein